MITLPFHNKTVSAFLVDDVMDPNRTIQDKFLRAAFTGNDEILLQSLKQTLDGKSSGKIIDPDILRYVEYCTQHRNPDIAAIASQIISPTESTTATKKDPNTAHSEPKILKTTKVSQSPRVTSSKAIKALPSSPSSLPPPHNRPNTSKPVVSTKKPSPTQRAFNTLEKGMDHHLESKTKAEHSLILEITEFLFKSLESVKTQKSFEGISFRSDFISSIFHKLSRMMALSLIDADLLRLRNDDNRSLQHILRNVMDTNISMQDKRKSQKYRNYASAIDSEMKRILQSEHKIKDSKSGKEEAVTLSSVKHSGQKRKHRESDNVRNPLTPQNAKRSEGPPPSKRRKMADLSTSKVRASSTPKALNTSNGSTTIKPSSGSKAISRPIKTERNSTPKASNALNGSSTTKISNPSKTMSRPLKSEGDPSQNAVSAPAPFKSMIKDGSTDSESEGSDSDSVVSDTPIQPPSPRRSARNAQKTEKSNKSLFSSDVFGKESEDESSSSEDEQQKRLQIKKEKEFLENKKRNKERIEQQKEMHKIRTDRINRNGAGERMRPRDIPKAPRSTSKPSGRKPVTGRPIKPNAMNSRSQRNGPRDVPKATKPQKSEANNVVERNGRDRRESRDGARIKSAVKEERSREVKDKEESKESKESGPKVVMLSSKTKKTKRRRLDIPKPPDLSIESDDLSDSPSLSMSDTELNVAEESSKEKEKKKESENKKVPNDKTTRQILEKFVTAYRKKENIRMWLITLRAMSVEQLSIIKNDSRFLKYLKRLKTSDKYKTFALDILQKCK